jgi:hypothetical protein
MSKKIPMGARERDRRAPGGLIGQVARIGPTTLGLNKDAIRQIALRKLEVVYRDWHFKDPPFADFATEAGERREDARAFVIALAAALLGGLPDAIEQNNKAIAAVLARRGSGRHRPDR